MTAPGSGSAPAASRRDRARASSAAATTAPITRPSSTRRNRSSLVTATPTMNATTAADHATATRL